MSVPLHTSSHLQFTVPYKVDMVTVLILQIRKKRNNLPKVTQLASGIFLLFESRQTDPRAHAFNHCAIFFKKHSTLWIKVSQL
jgi:hypothetical protein